MAALHGVRLIVAIAIVLFLLVGEPLLGRVAHRRFLAAVASGKPDVRVPFFRRWTLRGWAVALAVLGLAIFVFGWTPSELGLRLPKVSSSDNAGFLGGLAIALIGGVAVSLFLARKAKRAGKPKPKPVIAGGENVLRLLPRTPRERRAFAALAVTAGITEEVVWRGFGLAFLLAAFPHLSMPFQIAILGFTFGWAHLYQGWTGMLATGLLGALLAGIYVWTGSLLVPMVLHVFIDLRALLLPLDGDAPAAADSSSSS